MYTMNIIYYTLWCGYCEEIKSFIKKHSIDISFIKVNNIDTVIIDNKFIVKKEFTKMSPLFVSNNEIIGGIYSFMHYYKIKNNYNR